MAVQYLVPEGKHLPYTGDDGKPDHTRMGAAWAALHGGYRGNKYEGPDKAKAIAKLKRIYKEEGMELPSEKAAGGASDIKYLSAPILKVYEGDDDSLYVDGCLAAEEVDEAGEVMDWASSIPNFKAWNKSFAQKTAGAEGGASVGNLRVMHQRIVAGKFVRMEYDEDAKKVFVTAKITSPSEQENVREGVYTAFSVGAKYMKKWWDAALKATRWTAKPFEGSLVDYGAMPSTNGFVYRTLDGTEENRTFDGGRRALREAFEAAGKTLTTAQEDRFVAVAHKGLYGVSSFAQLVQSLVYLKESIEFEREQEGDDSPVTDRIAEATDELLECLAAYTQEQVSEEITRTNKEKTMDLDDLAGQVKRTAGKAAGGDDNKVVELKTKRDAALDAATKAVADAKAAEAAWKAAGGKDDGDADEKCMKSEGECDNENCKQHGEAVKKRKEKSKTAAAGAGEGEALKRADIEALIETKLAAQFQPVNESLKIMADTLKAIAASPAASNVRRNGVAVVGKNADGGGDNAEKTISTLMTEGKTVDALILARQRPQFVTTGA